MNVKEALFLRDNLKKKLSELYAELLSYRKTPIAVNGDKVDIERETENVKRIYNDITETIASIEDLSDKINKAALQSGIKNLLEEVQLKRELLFNLKSYLSNGTGRYYDDTKIKAEAGVGIVKYGAPYEDNIIQ